MIGLNLFPLPVWCHLGVLFFQGVKYRFCFFTDGANGFDRGDGGDDGDGGDGSDGGDGANGAEKSWCFYMPLI